MNYYWEEGDTESESERESEMFDDYSSYAKRRKTYPYRPMKPVIRTNVSELKNIASAVIAISLWKHMNMIRDLSSANEDCAKKSYCWKSLQQKVIESSIKLPVPPPVKTQIDEYIAKVQKEIANWATYHFRSVYLNTTKDYVVYDRVSDLIWNSDGTINCKESAKNIAKSKSSRLSEVEKYYFLCTYCLKDEIAEMLQKSPALSEIFDDDVDYDQYPLIYYWNCHFGGYIMEPDRNLSLDSTMFRHLFVDNWPAKEYFFDRMTPEEQVENALWLINGCGRGVVDQKLVLGKLNEAQRISVYLEKSVQIITNYVRTGVHSIDVLKTWSEVRNLITREQFVTLFEECLKARAPADVLTKIWTSVDYDLKNHLLNYKNYEFIEKILKSFEWTKNFNFWIIVLQDLNADMKTHIKAFFVDFFERLFSQREHLQWFHRLSDVYFGEESNQFKQHFLLSSKSIKNLCLSYYSSGDVKSLNDMLTYLFSQIPDRIPEYKRNLLQSTESISKCIDLLIWKTDALNEIIIDALPATDMANNFRKKLVFSSSVVQKLKCVLPLDEDFAKVKTIIDGFLTSDEDKANLKKSLVDLDDPSKLVHDFFSKFYKSNLQSLLIWIFEEENLVKEFKSRISVHSIFNTMLEEAGSGRISLITFSSLDQFLIWYFESPSEAKKYKIGRIYSYSNIDLVTRLLSGRKLEDVQGLQKLMRWFFEDDAAEIAKFNQVYKNKGKIARVL